MIAAGGSAFSGTVGHIVLMGAKKKMQVVDTRREITFVQNIKARWDRSVFRLPCVTVRSYFLFAVPKITVLRTQMLRYPDIASGVWFDYVFGFKAFLNSHS